jgi:hypothetical protein
MTPNRTPTAFPRPEEWIDFTPTSFMAFAGWLAVIGMPLERRVRTRETNSTFTFRWTHTDGMGLQLEVCTVQA